MTKKEAEEKAKIEESEAKTYWTMVQAIRKNARIVALEKGPGTTEKVFSRTMDGIWLEATISIYIELVGQIARQNRNVEQSAAEIAAKAIKCADELVKSLTTDRS